MKKKIIIIMTVIIGLFLFVFVLGGGLSMLRFGKTAFKTSSSSDRESLYVESSGEDTDKEIDYDNAYKGSKVPDNVSEEALEKYLVNMEPADDEYDRKYATDFTDLYLVKMLKGRDCAAYERILGYADATTDQIREALDANDNISQKYKDFIHAYACDLRKIYPEVNLAVLRHNLETLVIDEMTQEEIDRETLSTNSAACYLRYENRICVLEDLDLSRESDDYIILVHELGHASRSVQIRTDDPSDYETDIGFYDYYRMGTYAEEGLLTNISYELQGLGNKATFYPVLASYYRIICDCIGYSGEEFFNHSVNHLIGKMDEFMSDEQYAYKIVAMIDAQMSLRYTPYQAVDFYDFQPLYDYLIRMYCRKYLSPDMSPEQAETVFDRFYEDISFNFENLNRGYDIDESTFRPAFEECLKEIGIF